MKCFCFSISRRSSSSVGMKDIYLAAKKLFTFMKHRIFGNSVVSFCTKQNTNSWIVILAFYKVDIKIDRISLDVLLAVNECKMYSTSLQMRFSSTTFLPWDW